jgi:hypothetical protein
MLCISASSGQMSGPDGYTHLALMLPYSYLNVLAPPFLVDPVTEGKQLGAEEPNISLKTS